MSFEALASRIHLTQPCEKTYFQYRDGDDGWGTITLLCPEHTFSRFFPESQVVVAVPENTIIGPVLEVRIVNILDGYGIEVAVPSIINPANTSYVVISRETERFVNELHNHEEELGSSNEWLTAERGSTSNKETCALNSIKESCASPHHNPIGHSLLKENCHS